MQIETDSVVGIDYTLKNDLGEILDSSEGQGPLYYLHGHSSIVEGLEDALSGRRAGDSLEVTVPPEKGYGAREAGLVLQVTRDKLPEDLDPQPGVELAMEVEDGVQVPVRIHEVEQDIVTLDANHELAGVTLHFSVQICEVRRATAEELAHGHVHGPGGHHH